jgi:hypothetical protein
MYEQACLIGFSGFVGSSLRRQNTFPHLFNRSSIGMLPAAPEFDLTVCAAAPGSMFEANRAPERDLSQVESLMESLGQLKTRHFVLISSIAVLEDYGSGYDEATALFTASQSYGAHRRALELFCAERFENCLIVRLPALFGEGLRKNFIFDLLNPVPSLLTEKRLEDLALGLGAALGGRLIHFYQADAASGLMKLNRAALNLSADRSKLEQAVNSAGFAAVGFHSPAAAYQYYDMTRLWRDIVISMAAGLREIHLATEPLFASRIHERLLGSPMPETGARQHHEDMRTRHSCLWGRLGPYLEDADRVLDGLAAFFAAQKAVA